MKILQEFKDFAVKGNVVDMAVGVIIGAAFGKIVTALVSQVVMPPIGLLLGNVDFSSLDQRVDVGKLVHDQEPDLFTARRGGLERAPEPATLRRHRRVSQERRRDALVVAGA